MRSLSDPRHTARKMALGSIFCWLFTESDREETSLLTKELNEELAVEHDAELTDFLIEGVKAHINEIDKIIEDSAVEWPIDKIAKIDLVVLRLAIFELVFGKKAPTKVIVDEAVELSKEFGNDTSHKFVNGVLGTIIEKYLDKKNE